MGHTLMKFSSVELMILPDLSKIPLSTPIQLPLVDRVSFTSGLKSDTPIRLHDYVGIQGGRTFQ